MIQLVCPQCENTLSLCYQREDFNGIYGLLKCECRIHPIIADIPILFWEYPQGSVEVFESITFNIKKGECKHAFLEMCEHCRHKLPKKKQNLFRRGLKKIGKNIFRFNDQKVRSKDKAAFKAFLLTKPENHTSEDLIDFYFLNFGYHNMDARDYFLYRFSQPRHLVSLSLMNTLFINKCSILDLACGMGHLTRGLRNLNSRCKIVGLDRDFFLLYIARHSIAKGIDFVCAYADNDLPFNHGKFDGIVCNNAFHFFLNKKHCAEELDRITKLDGRIILSSIRHKEYKASITNRTDSIKNYMNLFNFSDVNILSDSDILCDYLNKRGPNLTQSINAMEASGKAFISLVANKKKSQEIPLIVFKQYPHAFGKLHVNPLYRIRKIEKDSKSIIFALRFPSQSYENENVLMKRYLPKLVKIPINILQSSNKNSILRDLLIAQCVLIELPSSYVKNVCAYPTYLISHLILFV